MNPDHMNGLFFLIFFGFSFFLVWLLYRRSRGKIKKHWQQLASELQLTYESIGSLHGVIDGYQIRTKHRRSGENDVDDEEVVYTQLIISTTSNMPDGLVICGNELFISFLKLLGAQDIVVGIPLLDDPLIIKGKDPDLVTQFFHRLKQREALLSLCCMSPKSGVHGNNCIIEIENPSPSKDEIMTVFRDMEICVKDLSTAMNAVYSEGYVEVQKEFSDNSTLQNLPLEITKNFLFPQSDQVPEEFRQSLEETKNESAADAIKKVYQDLSIHDSSDEEAP